MSKPPSFSNADKLAQAGEALPLFAPPAPAQAHSETSKAAARSVKSTRGRIMQMVLGSLRASMPYGRTDEDLQGLLGIPGNTERPARVALVQQGLVVDSGNTARTSSGRKAVLWVVARTENQG